MGEFTVKAVPMPDEYILSEVAAQGDIGDRHWQMSHTLGLGGAALVLEVEGKDKEVIDLRMLIEQWVRNDEVPVAGGTTGTSEMTEAPFLHGDCPLCGRST